MTASPIFGILAAGRDRGVVRVVIADDHPLFAEAMRVVLEQLHNGLAVVGLASDGDHAVTLASQENADLVLLDINMPVLNGFEAAEKIRSRRPQAQIVFLTGSYDPRDEQRARALGARAYITKDEWVTHLSRVLEEEYVSDHPGLGALSS